MAYAPAVVDSHIEPGAWDAAIARVDGPQLIVAGPGTGKTEFLVRRAAHLIDDLGIAADRVLLLTFSRRAAADLRRRVEDRIARSTTGIPASTFHSFALRLLELHAPAVLGWSSLPTILTGPEQVALVAELLAQETEQSWPAPFRAMLTTRTFAAEVADFVMRSQERLLSAETLAALAAQRADWRALPDFVRRYHERLKRDHRIDYGTLQAQAVRLLGDLTVRAQVAEQYRFVLVDEYQDTTVAQAGLLDGLTAVRRNLTVAADPYQSVYSFRGAELDNVAEFPHQFRDPTGAPARRVVLSTSFRVPAAILGAAERLTAGELPGGAGPVQPAAHQGRVDVHLFDQLSHEADWIAEEVQRLHLEEGIALDDMAVLVRTKRRILPELSRALERRSIAHDKPESRLVDHPAIRPVFDCVALAMDDGPMTDASATRLLLGPLFRASIGTQRDLDRMRARTGASWRELFADHVAGGRPMALLLQDPAWAGEWPAADGFWHLWTSLPQFPTIVADPDLADHRTAWTSFSQALTRLAERDPRMTLATYVQLADADDFEATPMLSYRRPNEKRLTLTTLHQAKGLEFEVVFIADAVEGVFPDLRRRRSILQTERLSNQAPEGARRRQLREEMRLAYAAMTRARRRVVWTATEAGLDEGENRPSRFLLAVAGTDDPSATRAPDRSGSPVTIAEAEALLRSTLADPAAAIPLRLAAAAVLVARPHPELRDPRSFALTRRPGPATGVVQLPLRMSPSQAVAYEQCPRRYVLERRLRIGSEPSVYMAFGSLIHAVLEAVERVAAGRQARSTLAEALAALDKRFADYDFGPGAWRDAWYRRAQRCLRNLYEHWPRPEDRAVLLEHRLRLQLGGVDWHGIADRIETASGQDGLRIVDYKTATQPPPAAEAAVSLQLGFYLLAARADEVVAEFGEPREAEFWYPMKTSRPDKPIVLDAARIEEVESRLIATADSLAQEDWTPRPNERCDRCRVRILCPEWPEGREAFVR